MPATYEKIFSNTLTTAATDLTFSNIPNTYTDLILVINSAVATLNNSSYIQFNGNSTGNKYSVTIFSTNGSTITATRYTSFNSPYIEWNGIPSTTANETANIVHIMNYANTNVYKTFLCRSNNGTYGVDGIAGTWRDTSAIDSIKIIQPTYNFSVGSSFTLYGIKAA